MSKKTMYVPADHENLRSAHYQERAFTHARARTHTHTYTTCSHTQSAVHEQRFTINPSPLKTTNLLTLNLNITNNNPLRTITFLFKYLLRVFKICTFTTKVFYDKRFFIIFWNTPYAQSYTKISRKLAIYFEKFYCWKHLITDTKILASSKLQYSFWNILCRQTVTAFSSTEHQK